MITSKYFHAVNEYVEPSVEEKRKICLEEIAQHKQDLAAAGTPLEKEWLQDELNYWEKELAELQLQS